jgi:hypothetical protein
MKARDVVPTLRKLYRNEKEVFVVRRGCAWALEQITGEPTPLAPEPVTARELWKTGWFLEPMRP